jgi:hypothetical protein
MCMIGCWHEVGVGLAMRNTHICFSSVGTARFGNAINQEISYQDSFMIIIQ